jgi:hypothetical protein
MRPKVKEEKSKVKRQRSNVKNKKARERTDCSLLCAVWERLSGTLCVRLLDA